MSLCPVTGKATCYCPEDRAVNKRGLALHTDLQAASRVVLPITQPFRDRKCNSRESTGA